VNIQQQTASTLGRIYFVVVWGSICGKAEAKMWKAEELEVDTITVITTNPFGYIN
jgi:hypothetical protein